MSITARPLSLGSLSLMALTACAGSTPPLEAPVGEAHRATSVAASSEFDIFAEQYPDTDRSALTDFHEELAPYGTWVEDERLGTVWYPSRDEVGDRFTPYATNGRWTYGQNEYVWLSDEPWGWVTFHYGRWAQTAERGWAWIPGRRYAGAWVVWRTGADGYVGWGPAPASWYWQNGAAVRVPKPTVVGFVYARTAHLFAPDVSSHLLGMPEVMSVAARTQPHRNAQAINPLNPEADAPSPADLGIASSNVVVTPPGDPTLQRAWLYARPSGAHAAGIRPFLTNEPLRLKEWVAGGPHYFRTSAH